MNGSVDDGTDFKCDSEQLADELPEPEGTGTTERVSCRRCGQNLTVAESCASTLLPIAAGFFGCW
jgi:hypothetical protein